MGRRWIGAATAAMALLLGAACSDGGGEGLLGEVATEEETDEPDETDDTAPDDTAPDDTEPPATEPPVAEPPVTEPPVAAPAGPADAAPFVDPGGRFTFGTGPTWQLQDNPALPAGATFWSIGPPIDVIAANVNALIQPFPAGDIAAYIDFSVAGAESTPGISDVVVLDQGIVPGPDGDLGFLDYTATVGGNALHFLGVAAVDDGQAILLTFTAMPARFEELRASVEPYMFTLDPT